MEAQFDQEVQSQLHEDVRKFGSIKVDIQEMLNYNQKKGNSTHTFENVVDDTLDMVSVLRRDDEGEDPEVMD